MAQVVFKLLLAKKLGWCKGEDPTVLAWFLCSTITPHYQPASHWKLHLLGFYPDQTQLFCLQILSSTRQGEYSCVSQPGQDSWVALHLKLWLPSALSSCPLWRRLLKPFVCNAVKATAWFTLLSLYNLFMEILLNSHSNTSWQLA